MDMKQSFRRGCLVEILPEYGNRLGGGYFGTRILTAAEIEEKLRFGWIESRVNVPIVPGRPYEVVKPRMKITLKQHGYRLIGWMEVKCYTTGTQFYVDRKLFKPFQ